MAQRILQILVILMVFILISDVHGWWRGRKKHKRRRYCPSRDDEDHICCEWKTETKIVNITSCERCDAPTEQNKECRRKVTRRGKTKIWCDYVYEWCQTNTKCECKCCEGWTYDDEGKCVEDTDQDIVCENGGTSYGDYCMCPTGFSGLNCEIPVCDQPCLNGGMCSGRDGKAVCICPTHFTGKQCETPICYPECQNGGTCTSGYYTYPTCTCPPGFTGYSCEQQVRDGECPAATNVLLCKGSHCTSDSDCHYDSTHKCCESSCGWKVCTPPAKSQCVHNGTYYEIGDFVQMGPCKSCFCNDPDKHGDHQWECADYRLACPYLQCARTKYIPGVCCPVCDDIPTTARPTTTTTRLTTPPLKTTCTWNGTEHAVGAKITKNGWCETCTCERYYGIGDEGRLAPPNWQCIVTDCVWPEGCKKWRYIHGQCCPVCDDVPTTKIPLTRTPKPTTGYPTTKVPTTGFPTTKAPTTGYPSTKAPTTKIPTTRKPSPTIAPTTPAPTTQQPKCIWNGVAYPHMSTMNKTACETCTCIYHNGYFDWKCTERACPKPECQTPRTIPGECCPTCNGINTTTSRPMTTTALPPDNGPMFANCPKGTQILNTHEKRYVDIREKLNLKVYDRNGMRYSVKYTKEIIDAEPADNKKNQHMIIALSQPDKYGRIAQCSFKVHVYDNHAPMYKTCPSNIAAFEDEVISWNKPNAVDNVAIAKETLTSQFKNNTVFAVGSYAVLYVATDHQNNVGICKFVVSIFKRGTTDPTAPLELKNDGDEDKKMLIKMIIIGLVALIVLAVAVIVTACCIRKRRNARQPPEATHAYDNAVYETPRTPPPSYGRSFSIKLPPKYMAKGEQPPLYEELDVKVFRKKGTQNPVYDSTDELDVDEIKLRLAMKEDAYA